MVGGRYKEWVHGIGTAYSRSHSPASISGARPVEIDMKDIRDQVYILNESVQRQLEEADRRYMELYERHKRDKEQWMQSIKQRMLTMYSYFEHMRNSGSTPGTQPPPPPPSPPPHSQHNHTLGDPDGISDTEDNQYS